MPPSTPRAALAAANGSATGTSMACRVSSLEPSFHAASRRFSSSLSSSSFPPSTDALRCCRRHLSPIMPSAASPRRPLLPASLSAAHPSSVPSAVAAFSTTPAVCRDNKKRQRMRQYFTRMGGMFQPAKQGEEVRERTTNALFPMNPSYQSKPVLGERTRQLVWSKVVQHGESVKAVAAELGMDMRRVAAVVRLKEIEKSWISEGKPLAKNYAAAVMNMVPHTTYGAGDMISDAFEPINEIHTHAYTKQQLFLPVSESRHFTREDAARAFHPTLLSADKRMPIPELIQVEKGILAGDHTAVKSFETFRKKAAAEQAAMARRDQAAAAAEQARTTTVETGRFQFRIRDIDADNVGRDGRSPHAVGWRYGVPFDDRKRGQVKIPTSVG